MDGQIPIGGPDIGRRVAKWTGPGATFTDKSPVVQRPRNVAEVQIETAAHVVAQLSNRHGFVLIGEKMVGQNILLLVRVSCRGGL